ncbi:type III-A CRISPR-associated RAMP protein Csm5 [Ilyomonas limi]|uniref:CRISPR system Cms protein Csm5 n=1 Tax=Ilyomonas limi TaxID=2575867 RepID=A0A4U3KTY5_9BACT|nr:type III-A CRISPR-associated RAMP protein Csm5 [Ilyomonas limi]TKK65851.1 type III-A CRISPR-associated RAMP protein Csm5 [Ilyomonas limi]
MAKATFTTLTPVHVGSGQTLRKGFDFIQEGNKIGFLDIDKIVNLIGSDSIPQLSAAIEKGEPLGEFLRKGRGFKNYKLEDICVRIAEAVNVSANTTELKEHYRVSIKGACIPGSSLKGAIKTAIWESLATDDFLNALKRTDFGFPPKWKDATVDKKLFGQNANEKSTRFLKVGDCHFTDIPTQICEVGIYNAYRKSWDFKNGNSFLAEVIPAHSTAQTEIKLDRLLLKCNIERYGEKWQATDTSFITEDIHLFCERINTYTKTLINWEFMDLENNGFDREKEGERMLDTLNSVYKQIEEIEKKQSNETILRVGGSSGWKFTTGGWITKPAVPISDEDYLQLRRTIQKRDYSNMDFWPKTRKMTIGGIALGFVKISFKEH